jgi:hypothetical protein
MADFLIGRIVALDRLVLEDLAQAKLDQASALQAEAAAFIALLDRSDGDPEAEDATDLEDDFSLSAQAIGYTKDTPGCPASDRDEDDDPAEEDDPAGQYDEDGINTYLPGCLDHNGPGCPIADPDCGGDGS